VTGGAFQHPHGRLDLGLGRLQDRVFARAGPGREGGAEVLVVGVFGGNHQALPFGQFVGEGAVLCGKVRDPLAGLRDLLSRGEGSWQRISSAAIPFVVTAQRQGVRAYDIHNHVLAQARTAGMTGRELEALDTLTNPADGIQIEDRGGSPFYINGQHKAQAMLDQGIRRTITIEWAQRA
jgi:hypothetical protein